MNFLIISDMDNSDRWREALAPYFPDMVLREWPGDVGAAEDIDIILCWQPAPGILNKFPNLKAIVNLGAGVDAILANPDLPEDVPLIRLVDPALTSGMTEYMIHWVIHLHRGFHHLGHQQRNRAWQPAPTAPLTAKRRVGILGLGELGADTARHLIQLGFTSVAGWSRTEKNIAGLKSFYGDNGLEPFLRRTEILICLLPLTPATKGIINARTLAMLPSASFIINAARGGHIVEDDLLDALDRGHIEAAVMDVFQTEPLPSNSRLWGHPRVIITPHIASLTVPRSAAPSIAENLHAVLAGEVPPDLVRRDLGY